MLNNDRAVIFLDLNPQGPINSISLMCFVSFFVAIHSPLSRHAF